MNSNMTGTMTIKEVANILNCSVQAIYNRLEKDFKPYLKIENGKKRLDKAVLEYIKPQQNSSDFKEDFKQILNLLEKQNEQLQRELDIKNKQIENLTDANKSLAESVNTAHHQQLAETMIEGKKMLAGADPERPPTKKKWWQRNKE